MLLYCIFQTSPIKTKSPARRLNFNIPIVAESRVPNAEADHAPKVTRHYKRHPCSSLAERRYTAPPNQAGLQLKSVLGYNGNGRKNMIWKYDTGTWLVLLHRISLRRSKRTLTEIVSNHGENSVQNLIFCMTHMVIFLKVSLHCAGSFICKTNSFSAVKNPLGRHISKLYELLIMGVWELRHLCQFSNNFLLGCFWHC